MVVLVFVPDQIRTIYNAYPRTAGTRQEKSSSNDTSNLGVESSEAAVIAKTRVEGCTSFLRSALKYRFLFL